VRAALLVDGERLVSLTGRGGAGKTSLALVAARGLLDEHPGGVWLVRLATVTSADEVLPAVAAAIAAEGDIRGSPLEAIIARLRERGPVLLVLDNFERLLAAAPTLITLLDALPDLRMLVTSQAPLRIAVERCVPLGGLEEEAALALVENVARRRGAVLAVQGADRAALLDIVDLLDGLPLGLELAAARLGVLSTAQLRERLHESQEVLKDSSSDRPERQRSLRATAEWTLGLLEKDTQALFVRLGAFAGAVELEDLEAVAGGDGLDVVEALAGLLDVALVRRVESGDGRVRFGLPEALRQIAATLLEVGSDGQKWRRAHAQRQHDLAWAARTLWVPAGVFRTAVAADAEADVALRWAHATGDPLAAGLGAARAMLLADTGRCREAMAVLDPLLEDASGKAAVDAIALAAHAIALVVVGQLGDAMTSAERAFEIAEDVQTRALTLVVRGLVHTYRGEHGAGIRDCEHAAALARDLGPAALAGALLYEAQARIFAGELERAAEQLAEVERIGEAVDAKALWHVETLLADLAVASGQTQEALEHYAQSLEAAETRGDHLQVFHDLSGVANALAILHRDADAIEVSGLVVAQGQDVGRSTEGTAELLVESEALAAAERRVGAAVAADLKARGRALAAGNRVMAACQLARARAPA
jgi:predicted ATPase